MQKRYENLKWFDYKLYLFIKLYKKKWKNYEIDEIIKLQGHYTLLLLLYIYEFMAQMNGFEKKIRENKITLIAAELKNWYMQS